MAQFARPLSDVAINGWTPTPLNEQIDEDPYNDGDYIERNAVAYCEVGLSSVTDPNSSTGHIVRYRYGRTVTNRTLTLVVRLMQGSTEIASWTHVDPALSFVAASQTLTSLQADAITDYSDLRLRFDITALQNSQVSGQVSWAELEVPEAGAQVHSGEIVLEGQSALTPTASVTHQTLSGEISLAGQSELIVTGAVGATHEGEISLAGQSELIVLGSVTHATLVGEVLLAGQSELTAIGSVQSGNVVDGAVVLVGNSYLGTVRP